MPTLQQIVFQRRIRDVGRDVGKIASDLKLPPANKVAAEAAAHAMATDGVLVKVGCGSLDEFGKQLDLLAHVLKAQLVDERQLARWEKIFLSLNSLPEDECRSRQLAMVRTGIEFDLKNGSGLRVYLDDEVARMRKSSQEERP